MNEKTTRIDKNIIDETLYSNLNNDEVDPVELIIHKIKDKTLKDKILKAYQDTVKEGYPFDIKKFAERIDLKVKYIDLRDSDRGFIDDNCIIYVNKNHGTYRQRFSIAHLVSHYILHGCGRN